MDTAPLTHLLSIGQITFIVRAGIQVLSLGGALLLGILVLSNTPRKASIHLHDLINRVVGKSTLTKSSLIWLAQHARQKDTEVPSSPGFYVAFTLFTLYAGLVAIADVGFLGFHPCSVPFGDTFDTPLSVTTPEQALASMSALMVNGTDPADLVSFRCGASDLVESEQRWRCTDRQNSTYADQTFFSSLNSTDSDILMPRLLRHVPRTDDFYLTSYLQSPRGSLVKQPIISNGVLLYPQTSGLSVVVGVPSLGREQKISLEKTLSVEVEVGCLSLGIRSVQNKNYLDFGNNILGPDPILGSADIFEVDWTPNYHGPDAFRKTLTEYAQLVRDSDRTRFNESSLKDGFLLGNYSVLGHDVAAVESPGTYEIGRNLSALWAVNCSRSLGESIGVAPEMFTSTSVGCKPMQLTGSSTRNGQMYAEASHMLCASGTHLSMTSGTVEVSKEGVISLDLQKYPTDMHTVRQDIGHVVGPTNETHNGLWFHDPSFRFTLSESNNASGKMHHYLPFLPPWTPIDNQRSYGLGSAGYLLTILSGTVLESASSVEHTGLSYLDNGYEQYEMTPEVITRWGGQVAASTFLNVMSYNPWVALSRGPIRIVSTGGKQATCFKLQYIAGFIPLLTAAVVIIMWTIFNFFFCSSYKRWQDRQDLYGGISPLLAWTHREEIPKDEQMILKGYPQLHLAPLSDDDHDEMSETTTAIEYLEKVSESKAY